MKPIVSLTMNPSIDVAWEVDDMVPIRKLRSSPGRADPGGGGINVSRVIHELGGPTLAVYLAGNLTGEFLRKRLESWAFDRRLIHIEGYTRVSAVAYERSSGQEYRIVPPGPEVSESEWQAAIDMLDEVDADWLVLTGSLPRGVPADFYARIAKRAKERHGMKVVLDTSGRPLFEALQEGIHVVKPNQRELENLLGRKAPHRDDQEALCRQLIDEGRAEMVALSLGAEGALMVWRDGARFLESPKVEVKSAVGAGDSFVGALTLGLAQNRPIDDAFALAVATGAATVLTAGTELCHRADVDRLYAQIRSEQFA
jgi:6-phosphofructokinase 2